MKPIKAIVGAAVAAAVLVPAVWGQGLPGLRKAPEALTPPAPETALCGIMVSNDEWGDENQAGVYTIDARPDGQIKCIHRNDDMAFTAAALMHNNIMYAITATTSGYFYDEYSGTNWRHTRVGETDIVNCPSDLAYDPVTKTVYGGFWDEEYDGFSRLCSFDLSRAEASPVTGYWDERDFFTMAATPDGTVYSLYGSFNYLAKVTVTNKVADKPIVDRIKTTGLEPVARVSKGKVNSMTYDAANDRLLAVVYTEVGYGVNKVCKSALYEINPHTAEVTEIRQMPGNACFAGIYVVEGTPDGMAPAGAVGMTVMPNAEDFTKGKLTFSVPTKTFGGADLTERVMAIVVVNGVESVYGYYEAGQAVELPVELNDGQNTVRVVLCTDEHRGDAVEKTFFSGFDSPVAVTNVVAVMDDSGDVTLSWDAPTEGANGGLLKPESVRYTVVRMPGNTILATDYGQTTYTDTEVPATARVVYYTVLAYNEIAQAPNSVESNRLAAAGAFKVPFTETFDSADDYALWTVVDGNEAPTWTYSSTDRYAAYYNPQGKIPGDDWLISPAIRLEKGKQYKVTYDFRINYPNYAETFSSYVGMGASPEAMTVELKAHKDITNSKMSGAEAAFTATESGQWHIGFHYTSDMQKYGVSIDNVSITEFDGRVPAAVSDLTVTPGERGALSATVAFTVPVKDANGNELTEVSKAEVYREDITSGEPVHVFTGITPGQALEFEDAVEAAGSYTYVVKVFNVSEAGVAASASAYIGEDIPSAPGNLAIVEADGHPVVSWTAPVKGDKGGWFDPEQVTYSVYRNSDNVASDLAETTFADTKYNIPTDRQDAISYIVISHYKGKVARGAQTDAVVVGASYATPAMESFPEAAFKFYPWIAQSDMAPTYGWTLETSGVNPVVADHTGDRGLACFHAVGEVKGMICHFYSPKFDLSGLDNPTLTFYMYHTPSIAGDGNIQVFLSDGSEFTAAGEPIARAEGTEDGWVRHAVALTDYKDAKSLRVRFTATGDAAANIFIDDIKLDNLNDRDAALVAFAVPARVAAGQTFPMEVKIENVGVADLSDLSLTVSDGTAAVASKTGITVAANSSEIVVLEGSFEAVGTYTLTATLSGDAVESNNSAAAGVKVVEPVLPKVSGLSATVADGNVTLSWKAHHEAAEVTDDVESYKDWAIDGIGEWTMFDGDYDLTAYINKDLGAYPNASDRKAFQVCNANTLGIDIWEQGKPHSGNKMFMASASLNYVNNDWLISPRLNGAEQWISFFARSFTTDGIAPERMKVWYSTTDTDPVNFTALTDAYVELGETWVEYRYHLPEGARYFAINCVSDNSFAMFVDDITFNDMSVPAWKHTHYEVTCDGETVGTTTETTFTHEAGGGKYAVRPVFEQGAGAFCEALDVNPAGIGTLPAGVSVTTAPGTIIVSGTDAPVTVINVAGVSFTTQAGTIPVEAGVYMVTIADATVKVAVL